MHNLHINLHGDSETEAYESDETDWRDAEAAQPTAVTAHYRVDWAERNTNYNSVVSYFSMRPLRTTMQARYCGACVAETSVPWLTSPSRS